MHLEAWRRPILRDTRSIIALFQLRDFDIALSSG